MFKIGYKGCPSRTKEAGELATLIQKSVVSPTRFGLPGRTSTSPEVDVLQIGSADRAPVFYTGGRSSSTLLPHTKSCSSLSTTFVGGVVLYATSDFIQVV